MLISPALLASVAVCIAGILVYWSNPQRLVNRVVATCSIHIAAWLGCFYLATSAPQGSAEGLFWVRMACAVGGSIPLHFWLVKECIVAGTQKTRRGWTAQLGAWILVSGGMTVVSFSEAFIPAHSTHTQRVFGWGYHAYIAVGLFLYIFLIVDAIRTIRQLTGGKKTELQVWLLGGCSVAVAVLALMALRSATGDSRYIGLQPLMILIFYIGTAVAITTYRIFDARQILLVGLQKLFLLAIVAGCAFGAQRLLELIVPEALALIGTTAIALWLAAVVNGWLDRVLHFYPQATSARQAAFSAAQRESRVEKLESAFCAVLQGWGQSDHALIVSGNRDGLTGTTVSLSGDSPVIHAIRQLRWATPERLARERASPEREAMGRFLADHKLGVLVISEGPSLTTMVGVGTPASRRPYTYPQVTQLMELASIMESALERAHFSAKVQHTEQLATVGLLGASLAHEIRNPLVSIKTFVQLLPTHHQDPRFREKFFKLIGDEVGRIDQLTEQLLDLASPRTYEAKLIELHPLLRSSLDLVAAKAAHRNVRFLTDLQASPDAAFTDASAAKQVMLNLCFNAIQAVEAQEAVDRWVKIATRNTPAGIEMAVADSGPGIAPEIRPRLFQPFQTTKSSGFGLGLAICSDILANLNASISVDPPEPGHGATFRVTFPCQPLSS